jgi:uncharacterized repeat protein (TIGR03803 family)
MRPKKLFLATYVFTAFALLFSVDAACQQEKVLHSFRNEGSPGYGPIGGVISDAAGNLYGTTSGAGENDGGVVFKMTPQEGGWSLTVLHSFGKPGDGSNPISSLTLDSSGNLFGTTYYGGNYRLGTAFELVPSADGHWTESLLHSFGEEGDGIYPLADLILDSSGNLYGTTSEGGSGYGTVFELSRQTDGGWKETLLYSFASEADGSDPSAGLVFDASGNLYGTTFGGGDFNNGTVFELSCTVGGGWTKKVLYSFGKPPDGASPPGSLVFDAAGNLYSTTTTGGNSASCTFGCGTVFELSPQADGIWTEEILHNFRCDGTDGFYPVSGVVLDPAGNLYSVTNAGGDATNCGNPSSYGTVFELVNKGDGGWAEQILFSFNNGEGGAYPEAGVIFCAPRILCGTTYEGGNYGFGTVFELKP